VNSLSLNFSKTFFIQFSNKSPNYFDINITYENNHIPKVSDIKFWGLNINYTLSWKTHIDNILPKLCLACSAMRSVKPYVPNQMLKVIYYSFHSIMSYGIIFWGHSATSVRVFRLQKRIIRIMTESKSRNSCRKLFINLKILPLPSVYIYYLLLFVIKRNKELFTTNNEIHTFCTRQHQNFHQPSSNLTKYQTGVFLWE
jgi:hypothetical protein